MANQGPYRTIPRSAAIHIVRAVAVEATLLIWRDLFVVDGVKLQPDDEVLGIR